MFKKPTNGGIIETGYGMSVEFAIKEGNVTLAKLNREFHKIVVATGKTVKPFKMLRGGINRAVCSF